MTMDGILAAARKAGFGDRKALERLARKAAVLVPGRKARPGSVRGSKIGGLPSLSAASAWPRFEGRSLAFLAQIDLGEVPASLAGGLPGEGLLSFFHLADEGTWGFDPADRGKSAVLHLPGGAGATPAAAWPEDLPKEARFGEFPVRLQETVTLAPRECTLTGSLGLGGKALDAYADLQAALAGAASGDGRSLLLGHPDQVQGDMMEECALVTGGVYCGDAKAWQGPKYEALRANALDWRLLLQLHSFEDAGMCWGDLGCLYFWIREPDLRAREFGSAWTILQCT